MAAVLSPQQQALVEEIHEVFGREGRWPRVQYIEKRLHQRGIKLDRVGASLPPGFVLPDLSGRNVFLRDDDELRLTVRGLARASNSASAVDAFIRVVAYLGAREEDFMPSSATEAEQLSVTSAEVAAALDLSTTELAVAYELLRIEPNIWSSIGGNARGDWTVYLTSKAREYRNIKTVADYVAIAHAAEIEPAAEQRQPTRSPDETSSDTIQFPPAVGVVPRAQAVSDVSFQYDVCLSFAGEERSYVERVAAALRERNVRVFYDAYEEATLWGEDLYERLADIYQRKARFCVMFASQHYARKAWSTHERKAAQARALQEKGRAYILPARFDNTESPGLSLTLGYISLEERSPEDLAALVVAKLTTADTAGDAPAAPDAPIVPGGVPSTPEEHRDLLRIRPGGWEYLLFAGALKQGKEALEPKWLDHEMRYGSKHRRHVDDESAFSFLSKTFGRLSSETDGLMRVFASDVQEKAFGAPGTPGDPVRIEHFARRILATYEAILDWAASVRAVVVSEALMQTFELTARLADRPANDIREFIDHVVNEAERIPAYIADDDPAKAPLTIEASLVLTIDDQALNAYEDEMRRAAAALGFKER